jgi:hypothetical protein
MDELIDTFLDKILSIRIYYVYTDDPDLKPYGHYHLGNSEKESITVGQLNKFKLHAGYHNESTIRYRQYVDSVIFHELIHAVNFHKKLFDKVNYDALMMGEKYYTDPEEMRAYKAQMVDFLMNYMGFNRKQAENMMNKYTSDPSDERKKWVAKYPDIREDLQSEDDDYYYHVTLAPYAEAIENYGLKSDVNRTVSSYGLYSCGKIFLCDIGTLDYWIYKIAEHSFHQFDDEEYHNIVVFRIPKSELTDVKMDDIGSRDSGGNSYYVTDDIPFYDLEFVKTTESPY